MFWEIAISLYQVIIFHIANTNLNSNLHYIQLMFERFHFTTFILTMQGACIHIVLGIDKFIIYHHCKAFTVRFYSNLLAAAVPVYHCELYSTF